MKVISKIVKEPTRWVVYDGSKVVSKHGEYVENSVKEQQGWVGYSPDGQSVSLSTWMTDKDVFTARKQGRSANNIWKAIVVNRFMPLGHPKGDYTAYEGTSVLFS